jgi:hypothetical protein
MPTVRHVLILLAACGSLAANAFELQPLVVQVASGRQFRGVMDGTSTESQLVLRTSDRGVTLHRPIAWERIVSATHDGQPVGVAQLRQLADQTRQGTGDRRQETGVRLIELRRPLDAVEGEAALPAARSQVTTVAFDATVANWDGDVETDGVVLDVAPLDAGGVLAAVDGTLQVELFAPQRRVFHHAPQSGGDTLELVERWTLPLAAADFGPAGAHLRLPFGAIHPELDSDWPAWWYGLVRVRLVVPSHGVFEDSRDGIRIRPWAPNRDNLELATGRRFLPTERLGRRD